jgi:hypothetical protein
MDISEHDTVQALAADLVAARARVAELEGIAGLGCDAAGGGAHSVVAQGKYQFCHRCGETIKKPTMQERARKAEARVAELEAQVAALSAEPTPDDVDDAARLIAYEMADTMGDTKAVFWSGYTFKDAARTASRAALTAFLRRRSQP